MTPGLNSNVTHAGVEYHIQTEDLGGKNPYVLTLVFRAGAIVAREKVNYRDALGDKAPETEIKSFMEQQHYRIMRQVMGGQFQAADGRPQPDAQPPPPPPKPVVLPAADKSLDEVIAEYLRSRSATKAR